MLLRTAPVDATTHRGNIRLLVLLGMATGTSDLTAARSALSSYGGDRRLLGAWIEDVLVGIIGYSADEAVLTVHHLAVDESAQRAGVGRDLVDALQAMAPATRLEAETDVAAVDFYRRCGFAVSSLGERYPGVERFRVVR